MEPTVSNKSIEFINNCVNSLNGMSFEAALNNFQEISIILRGVAFFIRTRNPAIVGSCASSIVDLANKTRDTVPNQELFWFPNQ